MEKGKNIKLIVNDKNVPIKYFKIYDDQATFKINLKILEIGVEKSITLPMPSKNVNFLLDEKKINCKWKSTLNGKTRFDKYFYTIIDIVK